MKPISSLSKWYFSKKTLPYWTVLLLDSLIVLISGLVIYAIIHPAQDMIALRYSLLGTYCIYMAFCLLGFRLFHTYSGVIRFSSFIDLKRIAMAMGVGAVLMILAKLMLHIDRYLAEIYFADIIITALLSIALMWAVRVWVKSMYDTMIHAERSTSVFIYGVKAGGVALAKSINTDDHSPYKVVGFISDGSDMPGKMLMGSRVYRNGPDIAEIMKKEGATALVVSPLKTELLRNNDEMISSLIDNGIKIFMVPETHEIDDPAENVTYKELKEVKVEDLLPRDKIEVDMKAVGDQLTGSRILITGAAGSIGSEMVRQVAVYNPAELILIDQAETPLHDIRLMMKNEWPDIPAYTIVADIANEQRMAEIFSQHKPHYVFHAAAYKHVPMMEDNPYESIENNVKGTKVIADLAVANGTGKFVMVSTDKAVNPTNVMGCSKRICEIYVQSLDKAIKEGKVKGNTAFVTTRFGNVLGSNGSVIPLFEKQLKEGGPLTVTHPDIIRFFMLIPEACKLVLEAGTQGHGGEIFVFDMGKPVRIADLARRMILLSGAKNVEIKYTGLRDGEKLYEEVLNDMETTLPTFHPKIKVAKVREYDYADVDRRISELIDSAATSDDMTIVRGMKAIVPEFKSQHSIYEALDK